MRELKQSTAANVIIFMADSTDHITGKTGLTLTVTLSKDGGAFNSISPTVTERTSGWYNIALTSSHTDTLGDCVVRATSTGADASERVFNVVANVEADTYARVGAPAGASVSADVAAVKGDTANILADTGTDGVAIAPVDKNAGENGQAQGGGASTITLRSGASATSELFTGQKISIYAGTGAGQTRGIASYAGATKIATVARAWSVIPDATSLYRIEYDFGPKVDNALAVTTGTNSDKNGYTLSSAGIQAIWDALTSALTTVGSIGKWLVDRLDALISSRLASVDYTAPDNTGIGNILSEVVLPNGAVASDAGNAAVTFKTTLTQTADNHWKNPYLTFTTGNLSGQTQRVIGFNGTTKFITVASAYTGTPAASDNFVLVNK